MTAWGLGYLDGTALKYIARWKDKNGIEDLRKAIHFLEKLIEVETRRPNLNLVDLELRASMAALRYKSIYDGDCPRLCDVHDVADKAGNSIPIPTGELNDTVILREDNV